MGIAPESFWRLSLVEWQALLGARAGAAQAPLSRMDFAALIARYPD